MAIMKWGVAMLVAITTLAGTSVRAQDAETAASPEEAAAQLEFLKAQVDALQAQLDGLKKAVGIATPTWKGAPEFSSGSSGYKFKLTGELQFDAGQVGNPGNRINTPNLGFNGRSRRALVGAEGVLGGDFSYKFQFNFAEGVVDYEDLLLEYAPHTTPFTFSAGYFYPFSSLDNMTSNRFVSVVERSQLNDAFSNGRRLGLAATYVNKSNDFRLQAGAFNEGVNANPSPANAATPANQNLFDRTGYQFSARAVYSPVYAGTQFHLAGSYQFRRFRQTSLGLNYRARPFAQTTDQRFVATGGIAAKGDSIYGVEVLAIHGPLHVQGEAQYLQVDGIRPGSVASNPQVFNGTLYPNSPSFWSGYGEVGYWLTGETRGYKNGRIDRTKILRPVSDGGPGGLQIVGRVDYINLTHNVGNTAANTFGQVNGGRQIGYLAALNYWPIDYVRFTAEYARAEVKGGPFAAVVVPASTAPAFMGDYGTDAFIFRAQVDF